MIAAFAIGFGAVGNADAQTASQITPPSARPVIKTPSGAIAVPEASGLVTPAGADKLTVRLADVEVEGGLQNFSDITTVITGRIANRTVTVADIFAAAQDLEKAYAEAGYVLVRVVLPAQTLVNGDTLRLTIINGFIEKIEVKNVPERVRRRIDSLLAPLVGTKPMTLRLLERKLMLAAETPGTRLRSTLAAGATKGASVLIVETTYQPVSGDIATDNTLSKALGTWSSTAGISANSVLSLGEQIYARATGFWNFQDETSGFFERWPRNRSVAGGFTIPLGTDGLTLNLEATRSETSPRVLDVGAPGFTSYFYRQSARLRYPVIRSRNLTLGSEVSIDVQDELLSTISPIQTDISLDKLRILRSSNDLSWLSPRGDYISAQLTSSMGLNGLGARRSSDATPLLPLSRQGAEADFRKLDLSLSYSKLLVEHLAIDIRGRGQISFGDPLVRSEQIGIAAVAGLSSFDSGSLQGDQGFVVRGEVSSPWSLAVPVAGSRQAALSFSPYAFGAFGALWLEEPTALEQRLTHAQSWGAGLRLGAGDVDGTPSSSISLEWGKQNRNDAAQEEQRFTIIGSFQF